MSEIKLDFLTSLGKNSFPDRFRWVKHANRDYLSAHLDYVELSGVRLHLWEAVMSALWVSEEMDPDLFGSLLDRLQGLSSEPGDSNEWPISSYEELEDLMASNIAPGAPNSPLVDFGSELVDRREALERAESELLDRIQLELIPTYDYGRNPNIPGPGEPIAFNDQFEAMAYRDRVAVVAETMIRLADGQEGLAFLSDQFIYGFSAMDDGQENVVGVADPTYEPLFNPFALLQPTASDLGLDEDEFDPDASTRGYLAYDRVDAELTEAIATMTAVLAPAAIDACERIEGDPLGTRLLTTYLLQACRLLVGDEEPLFADGSTPSFSYDILANPGEELVTIQDLDAAAPGIAETFNRFGTQADNVLDFVGDVIKKTDPPSGSTRVGTMHAFNASAYLFSAIFGIYSRVIAEESVFDGGGDAVNEFLQLSQLALSIAAYTDLEDAGRHLSRHWQSNPPESLPPVSEMMESSNRRIRLLGYAKRASVLAAPIFAIRDVVTNALSAQDAHGEGRYRKAVGYGILAGVASTMLLTGLVATATQFFAGASVGTAIIGGLTVMASSVVLAGIAIVGSIVGLALVLTDDTGPLELLLGITSFGAYQNTEAGANVIDDPGDPRFLVNRVARPGKNIAESPPVRNEAKQAVAIRSMLQPMGLTATYGPDPDGDIPTFQLETKNLPVGSTIQLTPLLPDDGEADYRYGTGERFQVSGIDGDTTSYARHELRVYELDRSKTGSDSRAVDHEGMANFGTSLDYDEAEGTWTIEITDSAVGLFGRPWDELEDDLYLEVVLFPPGVREAILCQIEGFELENPSVPPEALLVQLSPLVLREYVEVSERDSDD